MKKILLLGVVLCTLLAAQAQRVYFVYLQTDNRLPFYVKTGDKVYSSSAEGYLIVPKLVDSTYQFVIGKPGAPAAEGRFPITINKADRGFLIRETDNKISLFDLLSMAVIEPTAAADAGISYTRRTDGFTTLLAQAADDSSILYAPVVAKTALPKKEPEATMPVAAVTETIASASKEQITNNDSSMAASNRAASNTTDTLAIAAQVESVIPDTATVITNTTAERTGTQQAETVQKIEEPLVQAAPETKSEETVFKKSVVTRRSESSTSEGFGLVFLDAIDGTTDTIRILIPNPKVVKEITNEQPTNTQEVAPSTPAPVKSEATVAESTPVKSKKAACSSVASENDFLKLRRNMAARNSEEDMVNEARKSFKSRCYSTKQIKNLSSLFLTSGGKYAFFDAAYPYVSDVDQFPLLQAELWDNDHINRFKTLIGN